MCHSRTGSTEKCTVSCVSSLCKHHRLSLHNARWYRSVPSRGLFTQWRLSIRRCLWWLADAGANSSSWHAFAQRCTGFCFHQTIFFLDGIVSCLSSKVTKCIRWEPILPPLGSSWLAVNTTALFPREITFESIRKNAIQADRSFFLMWECLTQSQEDILPSKVMKMLGVAGYT